MDAPYTVHLSKNLSHVEIPQEGCGYAMYIVLCDTDGTVYSGRLVSMSSKFSAAFRDAVQKQSLSDFDISGYGAEIKRVFNCYSTKDLVKMSTCRMILAGDAA